MSLTFVRAAAVLPAALLLMQPVFGQPGGAPQPSAPAVQPATTSPPPPAVVAPVWTPPPPSEPPPATPPEHPEPIYITGRVMRDDGQPLADPVAIESVCNGVSHSEGYAGKNGDFGLRLGDSNSGIAQDASVSSPTDFFGAPNVQIGTVAAPVYITPKHLELASCEIRARLPGYQSDTINIGNRRTLDNPDVGTIILHRAHPADGRVISAVSLAAPKAARTAFAKGQTALKKNQTDAARRDFEQAAQIYPGYAAACFELGKLAADRGQFRDGLRFFETAIRADPKYVAPYLSASVIEAVEKQWPQLAGDTGALLLLDPYDYPQAYYLNALANYNLRNMEAAERSAREAERLDTEGRFPRSWQLLGAILADRGALPEAAEQMRAYLKFAPQAPDAGSVREHLARLEALSLTTAAPGAAMR